MYPCYRLTTCSCGVGTTWPPELLRSMTRSLEVLRGLAAPRLRDDRPELTGGHGGQTHQDGGKPVVVRLGEELRRVQAQQNILVGEARDPDGDDARLRNTGLFGCEALHPDPNEALQLPLVANRKGEVIRRLLGAWQRKGDAADVSLSCH